MAREEHLPARRTSGSVLPDSLSLPQKGAWEALAFHKGSSAGDFLVEGRPHLLVPLSKSGKSSLFSYVSRAQSLKAPYFLPPENTLKTAPSMTSALERCMALG